MSKLLELIRSLYQRPGVRERTEGSEFPGDQPLPLIWLVRGPESARFLDPLARRLSQAAPPQVPHVLVDAAQAGRQTRERLGLSHSGATGVPVREMPILPLLDEVAFLLSRRAFAGSRLSRFDRYRLVDWLTGQRLEPAYGRDDRASIVGNLRTWVKNNQSGSGGNAIRTMDVAPDIWTRTAVWGITALGHLIGSRWLRERVPSLGAERRWLMRQPYMVPRHSTEFLGFAERLTVGHRGGENLHQLKKLLVHAFLEDLRSGYRRFRWRIVPRLAGWRRTAYVIVLLPNITEENGGSELLQLINEVRNETGQMDPLLVIAETGEQPGAVQGLATEPVDPDEVESAIRVWRNRLPTRRQKLAHNARHLLVRLPGAMDEVATFALSAADRDAWDMYARFQPGNPPWLVRRRVATTVVVLAVVAAGWVPAVTSWRHVQADCAAQGLPADWWPGTIAVEPGEVPGSGVQCLGYSDSSRFLFGTDPRLRETQRLVFTENDEAKRLHRQNPERPLVTLIYFSALTHQSSDVDSDHAVAEELEGLLLRQRANNNNASNRRPLLRVIVANGGKAMKMAPTVVREFLLPLIAGDPTIMGIVGLDRTVVETEVAISELGLRGGVPALGTTLTGTGLTDLSPLYFQMVPGNVRQARLVIDYARHLKAQRIVLYHPENNSGDSYIRTLVEAFGPADDPDAPSSGEIEIESRDWSRSPSALTVECGSKEIAFYAGRDDDFKDFLTTVADQCFHVGLPRIVADDAVSRFVATREDGHLSDIANIPVTYVTMGSLVVLAGEKCISEGKADPSAGGGLALAGFCDGYHWLRVKLGKILDEPDRPNSLWPGERVGVAYDAAGLFLHAVDEIQKNKYLEPGVIPHRGALAQEFREETFAGATGIVDFTDTRDGFNRNLALLRIENIADSTSMPSCEFMVSLTDPTYVQDAKGCPVGTGG